MGESPIVLLFIELLLKKCAKFGPKVNHQQSTVCLEKQIDASPENFTPTLLVMLETRPSKCPKSYTTMFSGEKSLRQKKSKFLQN